ncbi:MAG: sigma-70 family RNA polymerase sigma factor [Alphaproteobacteria bacterium]
MGPCGEAAAVLEASTAALPEPSVGALLLDVAAGSRPAFRALYASCGRRVHGVVLAVLRDRELAREVTQDVFVAIWQQAGRFDPAAGSATSWIGTIARNRAIDRLRAERSRGYGRSDADPLDDQIAASAEPAVSADSLSVRRALAAMRPEYRRALMLAYWRGYTHAELAQAMGVPLGTAKAWVRRALAAMRETLA